MKRWLRVLCGVVMLGQIGTGWGIKITLLDDTNVASEIMRDCVRTFRLPGTTDYKSSYVVEKLRTNSVSLDNVGEIFVCIGKTNFPQKSLQKLLVKEKTFVVMNCENFSFTSNPLILGITTKSLAENNIQNGNKNFICSTEKDSMLFPQIIHCLTLIWDFNLKFGENLKPDIFKFLAQPENEDIYGYGTFDAGRSEKLIQFPQKLLETRVSYFISRGDYNSIVNLSLPCKLGKACKILENFLPKNKALEATWRIRDRINKIGFPYQRQKYYNDAYINLNQVKHLGELLKWYQIEECWTWVERVEEVAERDFKKALMDKQLVSPVF